MRTARRPLFLALLSIFWHVHTSEGFLGIPGNIASENGYDSAGTEPVCWLSSVGLLQVQPSSSTESPILSEGTQDVEVFPVCPNGTDLNVFLPNDIGETGLVTQRNYSFVVNGTIDLREWPTNLLVTDEGTMEASIHVSMSDACESFFAFSSYIQANLTPFHLSLDCALRLAPYWLLLSLCAFRCKRYRQYCVWGSTRR